jgi:hypothetical protein
MFSEEMSVESPKLNIPADLLAEVARRNKQRPAHDFRVEGLKPSLLERLAKILGRS